MGRKKELTVGQKVQPDTQVEPNSDRPNEVVRDGDQSKAGTKLKRPRRDNQAVLTTKQLLELVETAVNDRTMYWQDLVLYAGLRRMAFHSELLPMEQMAKKMKKRYQ